MFSAISPANTLAHLATGNFRLRYNAAEGNDMWIVYGHNENLDRNRTARACAERPQSTLLVKVTRALGR